MSDTRLRLPLLLVFATFALGYAGFIGWYNAPYAGGADSSGYMNSAKLMLAGESRTPLRRPDGLTPEIVAAIRFVPLGFRLDATETQLVPSYPIGLPLHLAALGWIGGLELSARLVALGSALAFLLLLYVAARDFGVNPDASVAVGVLGALSPLTIQYALQPMSDLLAAGWTLALIVTTRRAERHLGWAAAAGAAFAIAVLVRPSNLVLLVPALIALPWTWRALLAFGTGGLPGAALLAWYNHQAYGSMFATGYGDVSTAFEAQFLGPTCLHYLRWVPVLATPLVVAALGLPWTDTPRRRIAVLVSWALVLPAFYASYCFTHETWWYLRFLLPSLPAFGIAAALVLQRWRSPSLVLAGRLLPRDAPTEQVARGAVLRFSVIHLVVCAALLWQLHWDRDLRVTWVEHDERGYRLASTWLNEHLPADAMLIAAQTSGALMHYTDKKFLPPWNLGPDELERIERVLAAHQRPLYAALYPAEAAWVQEKFPGRWETAAEAGVVTIWRRVAPAAH